MIERVKIPTQRQLWLARHAELMNEFGPYSEEALQFVEDPARRSDREFVELAQIAAGLRHALAKKQ